MLQQVAILHPPQPVARQPRKGHRKSRSGCLGCKRRRVKCDEAQPSCANCRRFGLCCEPAPATGVDRSALPPPLPFAPRRGPGRPRRNWGVPYHHQDHVDSVPPGMRDPDYNELIHHFTTFTGRSLADHDHLDDPIARFWTQNAPQLGLSSPYVLHLISALAGRHLMHLESGNSNRSLAARDAAAAPPSRHLALTQRYSTMGLVELSKQLPNTDSTNCGSIYIASVLLCFCTFAAGPIGAEDLLVCDAGGGPSGRWLSLASGVRLIRTLFDPATLFSALLKPLGPEESAPDDPRPTCVCQGYPRVDWYEPLTALYTFITSQPPQQNVHVYLSSFDTIAAIYEATYGNKSGRMSCHPAHKHVLFWLYKMDSSFVDLVRVKDPIALLLLAYYAPLLKTLRRAWFMSAWPDHLLTTVRNILGLEYAAWLAWPIDLSTRLDQLQSE